MLPLSSGLFRVLFLLKMGMLNSLNTVFKFSHITEASYPEFVLDGHYYTSPNQKEEPPTISLSHSEPLPDDATPSQLRGRIWALHNHPYLPFMLYSPFDGPMTSRLSTSAEQIALDKDFDGYHLPKDVSKSWKTLEQSCRQIITVLSALFKQDYPQILFTCSAPPNPSHFGYSKDHRTESKARHAISQSLDAFVLLFAYVSFSIAICRKPEDPAFISTESLSTSTQPRWFQHLSLRQSKIHPEWLQLLADSPISNFTTTPQRVGVIINVSRCSWINLVPSMLKANVPIWLYWGIPPVFLQPLTHHALAFAPRSHPQCRAPPTPSQSVTLPTPSQSVTLPTPSQSVALPTPSQSVAIPTSCQSATLPGGPGQLPGETWKNFMTRQNERRKKILFKEGDAARRAREDRENKASTKSCPGKKGPTVYVWENDGGVWNRKLLRRGDVERRWGGFRSTQMIYNSIDNCWDICSEFDVGLPGEIYEYDSNDSDNDTYRPPAKQSRRSPTPKIGRSGASDGSACPPPIVVDSESTSDCTPMDVDPTSQISSDPPSKIVEPSDPAPSTPTQISSDPPPMILDPISSDLSMIVKASDPAPRSVPTRMTVQDASDCAPMLIDSESLNCDRQSEGDYNGSDDSEGDQDPYDATRQDVLNAHSFTALDLEQMPVTSLGDLLYYRYGFSLNESPYTGIPSSACNAATRSIRTWTEVCRIVGGQQFESSVVKEDRAAIQDFLSILAGSLDPFNDVPGKYWDLSPSGLNPIVNLRKVFISIEERQFSNDKLKHYIIRPRLLHPSRDSSWHISLDSMTALECIRRGLGPHTIDIANFLISHGVRFRALQWIPNTLSSERPPRPKCRYLGNRPVGYLFDLADFAGYQVLRDSFLRSQPHGPLALREGGIIARLAREVLPNSSALSGPSFEALSGYHAQFIYGDKIYVDDSFLEAELELICGTYRMLPNAQARGSNELSFFSSCF